MNINTNNIVLISAKQSGYTKGANKRLQCTNVKLQYYFFDVNYPNKK